jgi:hypothetical protein
MIIFKQKEVQNNIGHMLPYSHYISPTQLMCKSGQLVSTLVICGLACDTATDNDIAKTHSAIFNAIKTLPENVVAHVSHTRLMAGYSDEANIEQDMIKNLQASLRLRPDRILLGELRGGEAATFLQAISTGHEGSLTTIHASSCDGAIKRLIWLIQSGGTNLSFEVLKEQVQSVVDVVVQLSKSKYGFRHVNEILLS